LRPRAVLMSPMQLGPTTNPAPARAPRFDPQRAARRAGSANPAEMTTSDGRRRRCSPRRPGQRRRRGHGNRRPGQRRWQVADGPVAAASGDLISVRVDRVDGPRSRGDERVEHAPPEARRLARRADDATAAVEEYHGGRRRPRPQARARALRPRSGVRRGVRTTNSRSGCRTVGTGTEPFAPPSATLPITRCEAPASVGANDDEIDRSAWRTPRSRAAGISPVESSTFAPRIRRSSPR
jgi:hypothetical protein